MEIRHERYLVEYKRIWDASGGRFPVYSAGQFVFFTEQEVFHRELDACDVALKMWNNLSDDVKIKTLGFYVIGENGYPVAYYNKASGASNVRDMFYQFLTLQDALNVVDGDMVTETNKFFTERTLAEFLDAVNIYSCFNTNGFVRLVNFKGYVNDNEVVFNSMTNPTILCDYIETIYKSPSPR